MPTAIPSAHPPVIRLPQPGQVVLGKYVIERRVGEGGMGVVYAARHQLLGQRVAVKFLHPDGAQDGETFARFLREARITAQIESDHVARVLDVGLLDDVTPYMVLEYLVGADMQRVLDDSPPLPVTTVIDYLLQTVEAMAHAHALGIVHRDLKPSNLFLARRQDGTERIKVLDFGISRVAPGTLDIRNVEVTQSHQTVGTPLYMSPEQVLEGRAADHRSDIWALGVIAYQLLTGVCPFEANNTFGLMHALHHGKPVPLSVRRPELRAVPELEAAVMRCLCRDPAERYASVTELGRALGRYGTPAGARALENAKRVLVPPQVVISSGPPPLPGEEEAMVHDLTHRATCSETPDGGVAYVIDPRLATPRHVGSLAPLARARGSMVPSRAPRHGRWAAVMAGAVGAVTALAISFASPAAISRAPRSMAAGPVTAAVERPLPEAAAVAPVVLELPATTPSAAVLPVPAAEGSVPPPRPATRAARPVRRRVGPP